MAHVSSFLCSISLLRHAENECNNHHRPSSVLNTTVENDTVIAAEKKEKEEKEERRRKRFLRTARGIVLPFPIARKRQYSNDGDDNNNSSNVDDRDKHQNHLVCVLGM